MPIHRNPHLVARSVKAMLAACAVACGASAANAQPNVVLFFIDDMGAADWEFDAQLNPTGSFVFETPNMLRLAQMGVTFSDGYAGAPVCSPSRGALMTGRSAASVGITDFIGAGSNASGNLVRTTNTWIQNIPSADVLLPEALAAAGYRTGFFGKWHLGGQRDVVDAPLITEYGFEVRQRLIEAVL
ncbi:MAG: sulfatase-like hydrolase/transferase, partial [Planctomycetota bacterium]